MLKAFFKYLIITSVIVLFFSTCKKYPENTLWFKNPDKLHPFIGSITKYNVNGIDSLDLMNIYFVEKPYFFEKSIRKCNFYTHKDTEFYTLFVYPDALSVVVKYDLVKKNKKMIVSLGQDTTIFKKNIFISDATEWDIIRLNRKGPLKLKTTLDNGNTYEIEID